MHGIRHETQPGLRAVTAVRFPIVLLALVVLAIASTIVLVQPELIGGSAHATSAAIGAIPVIGHP